MQTYYEALRDTAELVNMFINPNPRRKIERRITWLERPIEEEYKLIQQKKSNLSRSQRDFIVNKYEYTLKPK